MASAWMIGGCRENADEQGAGGSSTPRARRAESGSEKQNEQLFLWYRG